MTSNRSFRTAGLALFVIAVLSTAQAVPLANTAKKALSVEDYTRWRSINSPEISGDGLWVAYVLQLTNVPQAQTKPELHIRNLQTNEDVVVGNATAPAFSADSKWIAYQVDPAAERRARENGPRARGRPALPAAPEGAGTIS
jgi:WD40-like Beta Propeller Repeat